MRYEVRLYYTHTFAEVITTAQLNSAVELAKRRWFKCITKPVKVIIADELGNIVKKFNSIRSF